MRNKNKNYHLFDFDNIFFRLNIYVLQYFKISTTNIILYDTSVDLILYDTLAYN